MIPASSTSAPSTGTLGAALLLAAAPVVAHGQTDVIQVYDASIVEPGKFEVTLHNNYAPDGLKDPAFPGGFTWGNGI